MSTRTYVDFGRNKGVIQPLIGLDFGVSDFSSLIFGESPLMRLLRSTPIYEREYRATFIFDFNTVHRPLIQTCQTEPIRTFRQDVIIVDDPLIRPLLQHNKQKDTSKMSFEEWQKYSADILKTADLKRRGPNEF